MRKTLLGSVLLVVVLTACGGGGSSDQASPSPSASAQPSGGPPANCTDLSAGNVFALAMKNTAFHPNCIVARSQQSIHITNLDGILHNFSITGTQVDVDVQPGKFFNGESAGLAPGTYQFFCKYHKSVGMTGTIVVK